jgi:hypothetical protein
VLKLRPHTPGDLSEIGEFYLTDFPLQTTLHNEAASPIWQLKCAVNGIAEQERMMENAQPRVGVGFSASLPSHSELIQAV